MDVAFTIDAARVNYLTIGSADNPAARLIGRYKAFHSALCKWQIGSEVQEVSHSLQLALSCHVVDCSYHLVAM